MVRAAGVNRQVVVGRGGGIRQEERQCAVVAWWRKRRTPLAGSEVEALVTAREPQPQLRVQARPGGWWGNAWPEVGVAQGRPGAAWKIQNSPVRVPRSQ